MKIFKIKDEKNCLNCIFFCESHRPQSSPEHIFSINEIQREKFKKITRRTNENNSYICYKGVWNCGIDPSINKNFLTILNKKRKPRKCFFVKYDKGMILKTADELLRIDREYKYQSTTRIISTIGALTSLIGILIAYYK